MIGDLRHRITLQKSVLTADGGGGFTESWQNVAVKPDVYAEIVPVSGSEQLRYHQMESLATHRITIRFRDDVTPAMRLINGATVYNITAVADRGGLSTYLDIFAVIRAPA